MKFLQSVSVRNLTVWSISILAVFSVLVSIFSSYHFRDVAIENQGDTLKRIVAIAQQENYREILENAQNIASQLQADKKLRKAIRKSDGVDIKPILEEYFHQGLVTQGEVELIDIRVFDLDYNLVVSTKDNATSLNSLNEVMKQTLRARQGTEKLKLADNLWLDGTKPMMSVSVPLGGLTLRAYAEMIISPVKHHLEIAETLSAPIAVFSVTGEKLASNDDYNSDIEHQLAIAVDIKNNRSDHIMTVKMSENITKFNESTQEAVIYAVIMQFMVMLFGVAGLLFFLNRYLITPLKEVSRHMYLMSNKDLSLTFDTFGLREIYKIGRAMNTLSTALKEQMITLSRDADAVSVAAYQLEATVTKTKQNADLQCQETEQTATAINEMSATSLDVAKNTEQAEITAHDALNEAKQGNEVVDRVIKFINNLSMEINTAADSIEKLEDSAGNIGKVMDVIRGVADQTNLLALNAAIEAARAGEHGRGFAVVAEEVRSLAIRTQESTAEIDQIISQLQSLAQEAVTVMRESKETSNASVAEVNVAGQALQQITQAVDNISSVNHMIATASEEQSAVAEEINQSVIRITDVAVETAQDTHAIASAAENLKQLSEELKAMVSEFKLK